MARVAADRAASRSRATGWPASAPWATRAAPRSARRPRPAGRPAASERAGRRPARAVGSVGGASAASRSESVSDSITCASAMPSAMQWCIRVIIAAPSPKPSTRYICHSGRLRSSGIVIRSPTSSCSAPRRRARAARDGACGARARSRGRPPSWGAAQRHAALDDPLAKARVAIDQARATTSLEALPVDRLVEQQHAS